MNDFNFIFYEFFCAFQVEDITHIKAGEQERKAEGIFSSGSKSTDKCLITEMSGWFLNGILSITETHTFSVHQYNQNKLSMNGAKYLKLPQRKYLITINVSNHRKVRFLRF